MPCRRGQLAWHLSSSTARRHVVADRLFPGQDALLEFLEFRTGFDAYLVYEDEAGVLIGVQCLGLAAVAAAKAASPWLSPMLAPSVPSLPSKRAGEAPDDGLH